MFLKKEEIADMTGFKRAALQIEFLRKQGYTVQIDQKGQPKVLRSHVEAMLGGIADKPRRKRVEPDFEGLMQMSVGHARH